MSNDKFLERLRVPVIVPEQDQLEAWWDSLDLSDLKFPGLKGKVLVTEEDHLNSHK